VKENQLNLQIANDLKPDLTLPNGEDAKIAFMVPGRVFTAGCMKSMLTTALAFQGAGYEFRFYNAGYADLYLTRNALVAGKLSTYHPQAVIPILPSMPHYTHMMWIDSDMVWEPWMIEQLLKADKDIIGGLCPINWEGKSNAMWVAEDGTMFYNMFQGKKEGTMRVDYTGMAFLLVKRGVFEALEYPWFDMRLGHYESGNYGMISEDVAWCTKATDKGFKIYIDRGVRPGHAKRFEMRFQMQHEDITVTFTYPRWSESSGLSGSVTMVQANFTTEAPHKFEEWELEAINGKAYRKSQMVQYKGGWDLPEHIQDEVHADTT
jgi:hypothetical protein